MFAVSLLLVLVRPRGLSEAWAVSGGALAMLLLGAVAPVEAAETLLGEWDLFGFFLGIMLLAGAADAVGFFDWLARHAARAARGDARRLFLLVFTLGALLTAFLSNDSTALVLTPVVYTLVVALGLDSRPYAFAGTFVADTGSFLLPVSNPINVLLVDRFRLGLGDYLLRLLPAALLVLAINAGLFLWLYRRSLRARFDPAKVGQPAEAVPARGPFRFTLAMLALIALAYLGAALLRWPLALVALGGAALLLAGLALSGHPAWARLREHFSGTIFVFIAGLLILVRAVDHAGLGQALGEALLRLASGGTLAAALVGVFGSALGANLVNNLPMALIMAQALERIGGTATPTGAVLVHATIIGSDVGPNLTTVGSLATMLWLLILRRRGLDITPLEYLRVGLLVTPAMLLAAALALWATSVFRP